MAIFSIMSAPAMAETVLVSPPLPPGENGYTCAYTNLTNNWLEIYIQLLSTGGGSNMTRNIAPGSMGEFTLDVSTTRFCKIIRVDRKTIKTKNLVCTFSAIDMNGNPTVLVHVDNKYKQQN